MPKMSTRVQNRKDKTLNWSQMKTGELQNTKRAWIWIQEKDVSSSPKVSKKSHEWRWGPTPVCFPALEPSLPSIWATKMLTASYFSSKNMFTWNQQRIEFWGLKPCHASPCLASIGERFYRGGKDFRRAIVSKVCMIIPWLSPCQERRVAGNKSSPFWSPDYLIKVSVDYFFFTALREAGMLASLPGTKHRPALCCERYISNPLLWEGPPSEKEGQKLPQEPWKPTLLVPIEL